MDLRQLEMLRSVVDCGGYSRAGEHLHVSHSAIHRQIRLLGQEFGSPIFVRSGKRLVLTEIGSLLCNAGRRVEQELAGARHQIAELNNLGLGQLRLGTGTHIITFFLQPVLKRFSSKYPRIDFRITEGGAEYLTQQLLHSKLDLAIFIVEGRQSGTEEPLAYEFLYEEEFVWTVRKGHPLAGRQTVSLRELTAFPLIIPSAQHNLGKRVRRVLEPASVPAKVSMELDSEESTEKMIEIQMGVGLISKRRAMRNRLPFFRISGQPILARFALVRPKVGYTPNALQEFLAICREHSGQFSARHQS